MEARIVNLGGLALGVLQSPCLKSPLPVCLYVQSHRLEQYLCGGFVADAVGAIAMVNTVIWSID